MPVSRRGKSRVAADITGAFVDFLAARHIEPAQATAGSANQSPAVGGKARTPRKRRHDAAQVCGLQVELGDVLRKSAKEALAIRREDKGGQITVLRNGELRQFLRASQIKQSDDCFRRALVITVRANGQALAVGRDAGHARVAVEAVSRSASGGVKYAQRLLKVRPSDKPLAIRRKAAVRRAVRDEAFIAGGRRRNLELALFAALPLEQPDMPIGPRDRQSSAVGRETEVIAAAEAVRGWERLEDLAGSDLPKGELTPPNDGDQRLAVGRQRVAPPWPLVVFQCLQLYCALLLACRDIPRAQHPVGTRCQRGLPVGEHEEIREVGVAKAGGPKARDCTLGQRIAVQVGRGPARRGGRLAENIADDRDDRRNGQHHGETVTDHSSCPRRGGSTW